MWALITAALKVLGGILGIVQKGQNAANTVNDQQMGANTQRAEDLGAQVQVTQAQAKAAVDAPRETQDVIDLARKGGL